MPHRCEVLVKNTSGVSAADAEAIFEDVQRVKDASPGQVREYVRNRGEELKRQASLQRERAALAVKAFDHATDFVDGFKNTSDGLRAFLVGVDKRTGNNLRSIYGTQHSAWAYIERHMLKDLNAISPNLVRRVADHDFGNDVARELGGVNTGNDLARDAAEVFKRHRESVRNRANAAGADIGELADYIAGQSHDAWKLTKTGFDAWLDFILPKLDVAATFGAQDPETFLREVYRDIVSGLHERVDETAHAGPANLANRLSRRRVLHFASPDDFIAYNERFGKGTIAQGLFRGMKHVSDAAVLMEKMGTNPDHMFERLVTHYRKIARANDNPLTDGQVQALKNRYEVVSKLSNTPVNVRGAQLAQSVRNVQTLAHLGGVLLKSLPDMATAAFTLQYHGRGFLSAYAELLHDLASSATRKETAKWLDFAMESISGDVMGRWNANAGVPGYLSGAANRFFRWNGLEWWTDAMKAAAVRVLSSNLADNAGREFAALNEGLRTTLASYGIDSAAWDVIRALPQREIAGRPIISADDLADDAVATRLREFFVGETDTAVITPGARERAIVLQGTRPGTWPGEIDRFLAMFHMYSVGIITKLWRRAGHAPVPAAVNLGIMGAVFGYMSNSLSDISKGRAPQDPLDPKVIADALTTGGGMSFLGDILFHNYDSMYGSFSSFAGGPVVSVLNDVGAAYADAVRGKEKKAASRLFDTLRYNMPFANLFYTQAAVNYLVTYQVQELMNPGYLQRMEKRNRKSGRDYIITPSSVVETGGGFR